MRAQWQQLAVLFWLTGQAHVRARSTNFERPLDTATFSSLVLLSYIFIRGGDARVSKAAMKIRGVIQGHL